MDKDKKKISLIEILCRGLLSIGVVVIAGIHLSNTLTIANTVESLFNMLLVGVVMTWGVDILKTELW